MIYLYFSSFQTNKLNNYKYIYTHNSRISKAKKKNKKKFASLNFQFKREMIFI